MFLKKKKAVSVLSVLIEDVYLYLWGLVRTAFWGDSGWLCRAMEEERERSASWCRMLRNITTRSL